MDGIVPMTGISNSVRTWQLKAIKEDTSKVQETLEERESH